MIAQAPTTGRQFRRELHGRCDALLNEMECLRLKDQVYMEPDLVDRVSAAIEALTGDEPHPRTKAIGPMHSQLLDAMGMLVIGGWQPADDRPGGL